MSRQGERADHRRGDRAMREVHAEPAAVRGRGVGHERGPAAVGVDGHHGPQRGDVAFAAADYPVVVEPRECEAGGGAAAGEQVEALDGQSGEAMACDYVPQSHLHVFGRSDALFFRRSPLRRSAADGCILSDELVDADVDEAGSEFRTQVVEVHVGGDQP